MITAEMSRAHSLLLGQLSVAALSELRALLSALEGESPERVQAVLQDAFPDLMDPFAASASAVSASFYEEVRTLSGVAAGDAAATIDRVDPSRWGALVGWGAGSSMFERGGQALVFSMLSGGLTAVMREMSSDTIIGNAGRERVRVGYQRVPASGCCAFCFMLASRGDLFKSQSDAERVIGRGVPVERNFTDDGRRRRGGQAQGIQPRGSRAIGERYHDHCRCTGVPVFEDNYVEMQAGADKYFDAYADARDRVNAERKASGYQGFGDQKTTQQMILAQMRDDLGVK